jgi:O-antigen ligase
MNRLEALDPRASKATRIIVVGATLVLAAFLGSKASTIYLLLGIGAAGILILVRRPGLGLVALVGVSLALPLTVGTGSAVVLTPPVVFIPVMLAAWLVDGLFRKELRIPPSRALLPLVLFALSGLLSMGAGTIYWDPLIPKPGNLLLVQLGQWSIFALSGIVFLLAAHLGSRGRWLEWATWLFLAVGAVAVLEFYVPALERLLGLSSGHMTNRSMFWTWLAALATGQLFFNRRLAVWGRFGLVVLLAAGAYVLWFLQKEWTSGWLPFTTSALAVAGLWLYRRSRPAAVLAVVAGAIMVVLLFPVVFAHTGGEQEMSTSWGGRLFLYERTLDVVKDHPILGLGPASYRSYAAARPLSLGVGRAFYIDPRVSSHNNYIDIYAQMGVVGLGLFLWFLVEVALLGRRLAPRVQEGFQMAYVFGAIGGLAGTLVAMMLADWFLPFVYNIGFPGFRSSSLAWMFLGGLVALEGRYLAADEGSGPVLPESSNQKRSESGGASVGDGSSSGHLDGNH